MDEKCRITHKIRETINLITALDHRLITPPNVNTMIFYLNSQLFVRINNGVFNNRS